MFSDIPQDLSAKFKTVSVQTEDQQSQDTNSEIVKDLLSGFSERQVRLLLGVLTQLLWKNSNHQEIPDPANNSLLNGIQKVNILLVFKFKVLPVILSLD